MTYDDAEWHLDTTTELGVGTAAAGIHIAGFLSWACLNGLVDADEYDEAISDAEDEVGTPSEYIATHFVSQIDPSMLTRRGNIFADQRYNAYLERLDKLPYVAEYGSIYRVPNTWESCAVYGALLDEMLAEFAED